MICNVSHLLRVCHHHGGCEPLRKLESLTKGSGTSAFQGQGLCAHTSPARTKCLKSPSKTGSIQRRPRLFLFGAVPCGGVPYHTKAIRARVRTPINPLAFPTKIISAQAGRDQNAARTQPTDKWRQEKLPQVHSSLKSAVPVLPDSHARRSRVSQSARRPHLALAALISKTSKTVRRFLPTHLPTIPMLGRL